MLKPRFKGCPPICNAVNLPAFTSFAAAMAFRDTNCPGSHVNHVWTCETCGCVHYTAAPQSPSGESSGTAERSTLPPGFVPFMTEKTKAEILERAKLKPAFTMELPEREAIPQRPGMDSTPNWTAPTKPKQPKSTANQTKLL